MSHYNKYNHIYVCVCHNECIKINIVQNLKAKKVKWFSKFLKTKELLYFLDSQVMQIHIHIYN